MVIAIVQHASIGSTKLIQDAILAGDSAGADKALQAFLAYAPGNRVRTGRYELIDRVTWQLKSGQLVERAHEVLREIQTAWPIMDSRKPCRHL